MFYTPTKGPDGWKALLADPDKHWRKGYSARSLAYCWEEAKGFPASVRTVLEKSGIPAQSALEFVAGFPEHKVSFPPMHAQPSQNDLFVLGRGSAGLVSIMVEGKVSEPFDRLVSEWKAEMSAGKQERLDYLCDLLQLNSAGIDGIRYQLLHRSASALIEAHRFAAPHALMLVHSFSQTHTAPESIVHVGTRGGKELFLGWVTGEAEYLER